jgi:2-polyprenyl-3-methyl-5-hydroxy-6-metoxy-1,4-benzoquinol methylase
VRDNVFSYIIISMNIPDILRKVESIITSEREKEYFLIHEARYEYILKQINKVTVNKLTQQCAGKLALRPVYRGSRIIKVQTDISPSSAQAKSVTMLRNGIPPRVASENVRTPRILDVGCFPYHLGAALEMMNFEVWGISSKHEPIKNKNIRICNIESDKFLFKDNFFDIVLCTEVLEHLPQAPLHAIREMHRVLMPRGYVILTAPNIARSINRVKLLMGRNVSYPISHVIENKGKGSNLYHRHNREYTLRELTTLLMHERFSVETAEHFISYTPFRKKNKHDRLVIKAGKLTNFAIMNIVPSMKDTLLVVGKK